jgi:leader peptidase (prepilin peptidase)/N-methyltransferase
MGKSVRQEKIANAIFVTLACTIVIASLVASPGGSGVFGGALGLLMLAIAVIDKHSFVIPDRLTLAAFLLGVAQAPSEASGPVLENIAVATLRGIVLALAFYILREIYYRLRHRQGIGLGDVKLAAVAGAWLDWRLIPTAIEIAALAALTSYAASQLLAKRPVNAAAKLPFGLFFALAIWFCWLLNAIFLKF